MPHPTATMVVADALVAWTAVVLLYYAWRGIGHLPILARLTTGLALAVVVLGSFGLVMLTFGAGGHAFVREPRMPWNTDKVASAPDAAPRPAALRPAAPRPVAATPEPDPPPPAGNAASRAGSDAAPAARSAAAEDATGAETAASTPPGSPPHEATSQPAPAAVVAGTPTEAAPPPVAVAALPPTIAKVAPEPARGGPASGGATSGGRATVLFGTDRAREAQDGRFAARRGNQLVLGRATVEASAMARASAPRAGGLVQAAARAAGDPASSADGIEVVDAARWAELAAAGLGSASAGEGRRALVYVHGYNTSFDVALARAASIARETGFDGLVIVYSWPSQGRIASYSYDLESARQSEPFLRRFLAEAVAATGAKSVSILAEGIGAGPVLSALAELRTGAHAGLVLDQILLAAPDVDARRLQQLAAKLDGGARGVTLYAAAHDRALAVARRFHGGQARAGEIAGGEPVVVPGVDTIDVSALDASAGGAEPAAAAEAARPEGTSMVRDMAAVLRTGARPPSERGALQRVAARGGGHFWRVTPAQH